MPVSRDYTVKNIESGQTKCDSRQEMSHEDFFLYVEHFVRFLIMLNKLVRIRPETNEFVHRVRSIYSFFIIIHQYLLQPIDPVTGLKRVDCHKRPGKNP
jgi:hypothetical protein